MTHSQTQGADGAGTNPFGAPAYDPASEIATQVMNLPWTRHGLGKPGEGFDDDGLCDRHGDVQIIARNVIEATPASTIPPDVRSLLRTARSGLATYGAGAFEGTIAQIDAILAFDPDTPAPVATPGVQINRTDVFKFAGQLLAEIDDLIETTDGLAGLHRNGDLATWEELLPEGQYERLSSINVLRDALAAANTAVATAATPGVPDSVRALSEAASPDWDTNEATPYILGPPIDGEIDRFEVIARGPHGHAKSGDAIRKWQANRMFAVAAVNFVRTLIAAQPAGQAGDAGADARTVMTEACKPWEHYTGEPPDDGSPLSGVFVAGMVYTERLLAKLLDVTHYEGGDGSEDFDNDATQTLRNILTGAGLWDADENRPVSPAPAATPGVPDSLREKVARLINPTAFFTGPEAFGIPSEDDPRWKRTLVYGGRLCAYEKADAVLALIAAQPAGQAGDAGADARTVMTEACKPWEHYTGEPPDDGSPLSGVFVAGMVYTERLLAKLLDVTHYEGGDGSEDFDSDATQTLRNILTGAGLWDADENRATNPDALADALDAAATKALAEELFTYANQLTRMETQAGLGGKDLSVRVKEPGWLAALMRRAGSALQSRRFAALEADLQRVTAEKRSACLDALAAQDQAAENDERARAAEARAAQLQAEVEAKDRAILLLLPFVDYAAGEGLMFVETEDGERPEMDAADIMAAVAEALGLELGSDAYLSLLPKGYFAIRTALAARAATAREGQADA